MWFSTEDISVNQIDATRLENPKNPGSPMVLDLFQRESRTAFTIHRTKRVFPQYVETATGRRIPKRTWSPQMDEFVRQELAKLPPQNGGFKLTIFGWVFFLFAFGLLGYLVYEGVQAPAKNERYEQEMTEKAKVAEGETYFGMYRVYKEKGNVLGSEGGFCWFKVVNVENDTYRIAKSVEISDTAKPKEELNSTDFEQETSAVKAKELGAYHKAFASEDGLIEITFSEKKE